MEPLSSEFPSTSGCLEAGGQNARSCMHIRLVSIFLIPHLPFSCSIMIKRSNYLFHGRSSMPFVLSLNSIDTIQTCSFTKPQCRLLCDITTLIFLIWITFFYLFLEPCLVMGPFFVICILNLSSENCLAIPVADIIPPPSILPLIHWVGVCLWL